MISDAVNDDWIGWTRRHFIANVRGGGVLPTIRVGSQPYALHPVATEQTRAVPASRIDRLETLLVQLLPAWDDAVAERVARLDLDAADGARDANTSGTTVAEATATLARILAATPNPSDLMLTPVTNEVELYASDWGLLLLLMDAAISPKFPAISTALGAALAAAKTLEMQIEALESPVASGDATHPGVPGALWAEAHSDSNDDETRRAAQQAIDLIDVYVLPLLYNHRERIEPLTDCGLNRNDVTGLMASRDDPPLFFSFFGETADRVAWTGSLVSVNPAAADKVRDWLDALVVEAGDPAQPAAPPGEHAPLLFQMLKQSLAIV
jgi:hypothetical protein